MFPGRHELITGDSRETVPAFADEYPTRAFDLIYIDGGHDYEIAKATSRTASGSARRAHSS
jgi:hypothetical protein